MGRPPVDKLGHADGQANCRSPVARVSNRSSPLMEMVGALILSLLLWVGGRDVIRSRQGATERYAELMLSLLPKR